MNPTAVSRPEAAEYAPHFEKYIALVPDGDLMNLLEAQPEEVRRTLSGVSEERAGHRYAEGKWSIRQVIGHLADSERVFGYRALCVARGEQAGLPGFDENQYVANAPFDSVPLAELIRELEVVREGHVRLLRRLAPEAWLRTGTANAKAISVRALAFVMVGHVRHHLVILRERYLA